VDGTMRKKKGRSLKIVFICFLSAVVLLINSTSFFRVYASDNVMNVGIGSNFSTAGTQVRIPVQVSNLPQSGLSAANFVIEFDDGLVLSDVKAGEIINTSSDFSYYVKFNKVYILFSDSSGGTYPIKNDGNLCYLFFNVSTLSNKNSFAVKRSLGDNEMFADNYLKEINPQFSGGQIVKKDKLYKVQRDKAWRITFNQEIDPDSLLWDSYQIEDINGQSIYAEYRITGNGKTLEILPTEEGYQLYNSYTLILRNTIASKYGKNLSKEEVICFYVDR
jgi:hypothetical protein